jgi:hypothetical protein
MSVMRNIYDSYRRPATVYQSFVTDHFEEKTALGFLAGGCLLAFISRWPTAARDAYLSDQALDMLLGAALFAWIFIAPLLFYALAGVLTLLLFIGGLRDIGLPLRLSLFLSFLAAAPLMLIYGLVSGFLGRGVLTNLIGVLWLGVFLWFLVCAFRALSRRV